MELKNRGYEVFIGKIADSEIDFIVTKVNEKKYIQATDKLFSNTDEEGIKIINLID